MVHFCSKFLSEQMLMSLSAQLCRRYPVGHYTGADSPIRPQISARVCAYRSLPNVINNDYIWRGYTEALNVSL